MKSNYLYEYAGDLYNQGRFYESLNEYKKCLSFIRNTGQRDYSFEFKVLIEIITINLQINDLTKAKKQIEEVLILFYERKLEFLCIENTNHLVVLGNALFYFKKFKIASEFYSYAEKFEKDNSFKHLHRAQKIFAYGCNGNYYEAISDIQKLLKSKSEINSIIQNKIKKYLGDMLVRTNQYERSIQCYRSFIDFSSNLNSLNWMHEAIFNCATAYFELSHYSDAINHYEFLISDTIGNSLSKKLFFLTNVHLIRIYTLLSNFTKARNIIKNVSYNCDLDSNQKLYLKVFILRLDIIENGINVKIVKKYPGVFEQEIDYIEDNIDEEILSLKSLVFFKLSYYNESISSITKLLKYYTDKKDIHQQIKYKYLYATILINTNEDYNRLESINLICDIELELNKLPINRFNLLKRIEIIEFYYFNNEIEKIFLSISSLFNYVYFYFSLFSATEAEYLFFKDKLESLFNAIVNLLKVQYFENHRKQSLLRHAINLKLILKNLYDINNNYQNQINNKQENKFNQIQYFIQKHNIQNKQKYLTEKEIFQLLRQEDSHRKNTNFNKIKFSELQKSLNISWENLRDQLDDELDAIAVFFRHNCQDRKFKSAMYGTFIIRKDSKNPIFIELDLTENWLLENLPFKIVREYDYSRSFRQSVERPLVEVLEIFYNKIFKPLNNHLSGIKRIYYTLDGLLNYLPFNAFIFENKTFLFEIYELIQIQDTSRIYSKNRNMINSITLFGGIDFGKYANLNNSKDIDAFDTTLSKIQNIPQAENEVERISESFKNTDIKYYTLDYLNLNKLQNTALNFHQSAIHIVTHGFFFNDKEKNYSLDEISEYNLSSIKTNSNPMVRSGIFSSDYNIELLKSEIINRNHQGVITAYDISISDFKNVELVTIHACEGALGAVRNGETYGLVKAFRMAGVKYVILSLWKINHTNFFVYFYEYLANSTYRDVRGAYNNAINRIKNEHNNPYWWSGFVLIE